MSEKHRIEINEKRSARLKMLEKLTSSPHADSFAWYGLAMEYKALGDVSRALKAFEKARDLEPNNVNVYFMAGQMLADAANSVTGNSEQGRLAKCWLERGCQIAEKARNSHVLDRMRTCMQSLK